MESQQGSWLLPAHEGVVASKDSEEQVSEHHHSFKSQLENLHGVWVLETADAVIKSIASQLLFYFYLLSLIFVGDMLPPLSHQPRHFGVYQESEVFCSKWECNTMGIKTVFSFWHTSGCHLLEIQDIEETY